MRKVIKNSVLFFLMIIFNLDVVASDSIHLYLKQYQDICQKKKQHAQLVTDHIFPLEVADKTSQDKLERLLGDLSNLSATDETELLKTKILIKLEKYDQAEQRCLTILQKKSDYYQEAQLLLILIKIFQGKTQEAYSILKNDENALSTLPDFKTVTLLLAFAHEDLKIREHYLAIHLSGYQAGEFVSISKTHLLFNLAAINNIRGDIQNSRRFFIEALASTTNPLEQQFIQNKLGQLELIGKSMPVWSVDTWLNTSTNYSDQLKDKNLVILAWALWNEKSIQFLKEMDDFVRANSQQLIKLVGYSKVYGIGISPEKKIIEFNNMNDEITAIKTIINDYSLSCPMALSLEGYLYESLLIKEIPAVIVIDKKNTIRFISVGNEFMADIFEKIKNILLEED